MARKSVGRSFREQSEKSNENMYAGMLVENMAEEAVSRIWNQI